MTGSKNEGMDHEIDGALRARAAVLGVETRYRGIDGVAHEAPRATVAAFVEQLEAPSPRPARRREGERTIIAPVRVTVLSPNRGTLEVDLGDAAAYEVRWSLELRTEDGQRTSRYGTQTLRGGSGRFRIHDPPLATTGYHQLQLTVETGNRRWLGEQRWIVVPPTCVEIGDALEGRPGFGLCLNLYAVRRRDDWGVGDLTALRELCQRAGAEGADFVATSPLHATANRGAGISPYAPVSRLFRNPIYLDVEAVPELAECAETRAWLERPEVARKRAQAHGRRHVDYEAVRTLKLQALRRLHRTFARRHRHRDTPRGKAYARYRREQGPLLDAFAVHGALDALLHEAEGHSDWHSWPADYRRPESATVRAFAETHAELVDFHRYLQFELDRQLSQVAITAADAGLRLGLVEDLAVGAPHGSFDVWAFQDLFVGAAELGCPPDPLGPEGQNWALAPLDPGRLREDGYGLWSRLLRNILAHAGCLRLDHVLGLVRQFWIPRGESGASGTYVTQKSDDLFGILALESRRAGAVVVGEDLGTVPDGMGQTLARWGVLSTRVLYFAADPGGGAFPEPSALDERALWLATTHDLPTLAAWWRGEDLDQRHELALFPDAASLEAARAARGEARDALLRRLRTEGLVEAATETELGPFVEAVHRYLAGSPAALVGIWLEDLAGESAPVNLPGVGPERYPVWSRRLDLPLDALLEDPAARRRLRAARRPGVGTAR